MASPKATAPTLEENEHGINGHFQGRSGTARANLPDLTLAGGRTLRIFVRWGFKPDRDAGLFNLERTVSVEAVELDLHRPRYFPELERDFTAPPGAKTLNWIAANDRAITTALIADLAEASSAIAALDHNALWASLQAEADEQADRARQWEQARAEAKVQAQADLLKAQSFAALIDVPGSGFVSVPFKQVSDLRCEGLLAVAKAVVGARARRPLRYGPFTLGSTSVEGERLYFLRTPVWTGQWAYRLDRRSWDPNLHDLDRVRKIPIAATAMATELGITLEHPKAASSPLRFPGFQLVIGEETKGLPGAVYLDPQEFGAEQAIGRLAYLNQAEQLLEWQGTIEPRRAASGVCRFCSRPLSDSSSITRGVGPECWGRVEAALRAQEGRRLVADLPEFAVPQAELVWEGLIEEIPSDIDALLHQEVTYG
jgi:Family of unknown function (DUF6011)